MSTRLTLNGKAQALQSDPGTPLLYVLRNEMRLNGAKFGCGMGQCGACTVIVDGKPVFSCVTPLGALEGRAVRTVEGLGTPQQPGRLQAAFIKHDGYQCGYCTPGQICSAVAVLDEIKRGVPSHVQADIVGQPTASAAEMRERMSGNICRCAAYSNIIAAIADVAGKDIA